MSQEGTWSCTALLPCVVDECHDDRVLRCCMCVFIAHLILLHGKWHTVIWNLNFKHSFEVLMHQ